MRLRLRAQASSEQRWIFAACAILVAALVVLWLGIGLLGEALVRMVLDGSFLPYVRPRLLRYLGDVPSHDQGPVLLGRIVGFAARLSLLVILGQIALVGASWSRPRLFQDFFSAPSHPHSLAIFRILYFLTLYPRVGVNYIVGLSQLPHEMRIAPPGLGWFVSNIPESPSVIHFLHGLFGIACLGGVLGLFTRVSATLAVALAFYFLGVPQFFGSIFHYHHLIWMGALVAASPCAASLSLDGILAARRGACLDSQLSPSFRYGVPLRFVWLFLGAIYFFPGFWKFVIAGPEWFWSDNLRFKMYNKWFEMPGWEPILRVDQFPWLCELGGLLTVVMEVSFVLLVFLPWGRYLAAAAGLLFHTLVKAFMNIQFWPIHCYYAAFFDWERIFGVLGRWIWPTPPLVVQWREHDESCRRFVNAARSLDLLGRVEYMAREGEKVENGYGPPGWHRRLEARVGGETSSGKRAFLQLWSRVPLLVVALPIFLLPSRVFPPAPKSQQDGGLAAVYTIGSLVLASILLCGVTLFDSWPVGVYPTFASMATPRFESLILDPRTASGESLGEIEVHTSSAIREEFTSARIPYLIAETKQADKATRDLRILSLWQVCQRTVPRVDEVRTLVISAATYSTVPEDADANPIDRSIWHTVTLPP